MKTKHYNKFTIYFGIILSINTISDFATFAFLKKINNSCKHAKLNLKTTKKIKNIILDHFIIPRDYLALGITRYFIHISPYLITCLYGNKNISYYLLRPNFKKSIFL